LVVLEILAGIRQHKDLHRAFDWATSPEGNAFWHKASKAPVLPRDARTALLGAATRAARLAGVHI
jgi:hypothetical protein